MKLPSRPLKKKKLLHCIFERFAGGKFGNLFRCNFDCRSCLRVPAHTGFPFANAEGSKAY
jgi:hypothetical protein